MNSKTHLTESVTKNWGQVTVTRILQARMCTRVIELQLDSIKRQLILSPKISMWTLHMPLFLRPIT